MTTTLRPARAGLLPAVVAVLVATAVGVAVGTATSWLQGLLPNDLGWLANSGAVWTLVAVAAAGPAARFGRGPAAVAGTLALLGEVIGYYAIASPLRGIATGSFEVALWAAAACLVGPAAGVAAQLIRSGSTVARAAALGAVAGVLAGEGVHALLRLHRPSQAWPELGAALLVAVAGAVVEARGVTRSVATSTAASVVTGVVVTGVVFAVYGEWATA